MTITRDFLQVEFAPIPGVKNEVRVKAHRESNIIPRYLVQMGCLRALYPILWVARLGNHWFSISHQNYPYFLLLLLLLPGYNLGIELQLL